MHCKIMLTFTHHSGTTLLYLTTTAFNDYIKAVGVCSKLVIVFRFLTPQITQGKLDETTGLYTITTAQFDALEDLVFTIDGVSSHRCAILSILSIC